MKSSASDKLPSLNIVKEEWDSSSFFLMFSIHVNIMIFHILGTRILNLWMVCTLDGWVYESSSFFCQWLDPWYCKIDCRLLFTYSTNVLWGWRLFRNLTKFTISWVSCIINSFSIWILNTRIQFFSYVKSKNLTTTLNCQIRWET